MMFHENIIPYFVDITLYLYTKQTVEFRVLWDLTWICTVCLCPTKSMLGLYGLTSLCLQHVWMT